MSKQLYAINLETGQNEPSIIVADEDIERIGRGYDAGHSFGIFRDQVTGKDYEVKQASCGGDNCNCAVIVEEV